MYIPNTTWSWVFSLVSIAQALIALGLEGYVFGKFQHSLMGDYSSKTQSRTIPTYLAVFMFGYIYQLVLVWDALRMKNTIQVIGLCFYNLGLIIYAAIQMDQIKDATNYLADPKVNMIHPDYYPNIKPILIALPCIMGLATLILCFAAWKLYDEFAWTIYKHISADLRLKRRYLVYQIYIALLKFDFFFFLGFTVQFLVVVKETKSAETYITIAALPVTLFLLIIAAYWTRKEFVWGMIGIILIYFAALAYFIFKLVRMYAAPPDRVADYIPARRTLTSFAVLTILLLVMTLITACWCTHNFNKGLKPHIARRKAPGADRRGKDHQQEIGMPSISGPAPNRMTID